jgi:hypothetical protein
MPAVKMTVLRKSVKKSHFWRLLGRPQKGLKTSFLGQKQVKLKNTSIFNFCISVLICRVQM